MSIEVIEETPAKVHLEFGGRIQLVEACKVLGVSRMTGSQYCKRGLLTEVILRGRAYVLWSEVQALLRDGLPRQKRVNRYTDPKRKAKAAAKPE